jgi:hypothetical protein
MGEKRQYAQNLLDLIPDEYIPEITEDMNIILSKYYSKFPENSEQTQQENSNPQDRKNAFDTFRKYLGTLRSDFDIDKEKEIYFNERQQKYV